MKKALYSIILGSLTMILSGCSKETQEEQNKPVESVELILSSQSQQNPIPDVDFAKDPTVSKDRFGMMANSIDLIITQKSRQLIYKYNPTTGLFYSTGTAAHIPNYGTNLTFSYKGESENAIDAQDGTVEKLLLADELYKETFLLNSNAVVEMDHVNTLLDIRISNKTITDASYVTVGDYRAYRTSDNTFQCLVRPGNNQFDITFHHDDMDYVAKNFTVTNDSGEQTSFERNTRYILTFAVSDLNILTDNLNLESVQLNKWQNNSGAGIGISYESLIRVVKNSTPGYYKKVEITFAKDDLTDPLTVVYNANSEGELVVQSPTFYHNKITNITIDGFSFEADIEVGNNLTLEYDSAGTGTITQD